MGSRSVSPGGALLRSSRLFAVPKPLPDTNATAMNINKLFSDSMTKASPQHQAITTPQASREKGDWGLKRPFPLKSTLGTTTPAIAVKAVDTIENITDFESAAGHTLTLEKFQDLRMPMTIPRFADSYGTVTTVGLKSVFEKVADKTDVGSDRGNHLRWKFRGPWLANMTEGEFHRYIIDHVRPRRAEFKRKVREKAARELNSRRSVSAMDEGGQQSVPLKARDVTDAQITDYLRFLRNNRVKLFDFISDFLDLAPLGKPEFLKGISRELSSSVTVSKKNESPYGRSGPPPCHPSAGIGYLRTDAFLENHPVYGPQARKAPQLARILSPRQDARTLKLGVAGFVADAPPGDNAFQSKYLSIYNRSRVATPKGVNHLDLETPGGAKAYVEAKAGYVDSTGRVMIATEQSPDEAQIIAREVRGQSQVYHGKETVKYKPVERSVSASEPAFEPATTPKLLNAVSRAEQLADEILADQGRSIR